jgi:NitT/TauT family transport system substrate-binding protein
VAVDNKASLGHLPLTIAERMGYFALEGLDLQVREFADAGSAQQAVLSGAAQALSGAFSPLVALTARGQSLQSIVLQGRAPQIVMGVSRKTLDHFRQPRDLRGRRIAVPALGSDSHRMARVLVARAGLGADEVVYLVQPSPSAVLAGFRAGQIDAICLADPLMTQLEQSGELRVIADTRTVRGTAEVFGGALPAACLAASRDLVNNNPRLCQALVDGMVHALKWLQTAGPSDIIKVVPEGYFSGDRALYLAAFNRAREAWAPDGLMPPDGPKTAARLLTAFDGAAVPKSLDLALTFTNSFAQKAKARFNA